MQSSDYTIYGTTAVGDIQELSSPEDDFEDDDDSHQMPIFHRGTTSPTRIPSLRANAHWHQPIPEGQRDVTLTEVAGFLRAEGLSAEGLFHTLTLHNEEWCTPPLEPSEVRRIAQSIGKKPVRYRPDQTIAREGLGIHLLSSRELKAIPKPDYLIADILVSGAITLLFGESGSYKSFLALDIAASVATGKPFADRDVSATGSVLYLAAEGMEYLGERLRGWEYLNGVEADGVYVSKNPFDTVLLRKGLVRKIVESARILPRIKLVIIDTYAKSALGVNENHATEVTQYLNAAQRIRDKTGAAVLILHHINRTGTFRGSQALMANVDAMIEVKRTSPAPPKVTMISRKNRGYEPFADVYLDGLSVTVPTESNPTNSTLVFVADQSPNPGISAKRDVLTGQQAEAFKALSAFGETGATSTDWQTASGIPKRTLTATLKRLVPKYVEAIPISATRNMYRVRGTLLAGGVFVPSVPTGQGDGD